MVEWWTVVLLVTQSSPMQKAKRGKTD